MNCGATQRVGRELTSFPPGGGTFLFSLTGSPVASGIAGKCPEGGRHLCNPLGWVKVGQCGGGLALRVPRTPAFLPCVFGFSGPEGLWRQVLHPGMDVGNVVCLQLPSHLYRVLPHGEMVFL